MTTDVMPTKVNMLVRAFRAAAEFVTAAGEVFGNAVHSVQAFCNLKGDSPANKFILAAFGKAVAVVRFVNGATNTGVAAVQNAIRGNDDFVPAHLLVQTPAYK